MMQTTLQLDNKKPKLKDGDIDRLLSYLEQRGTWVKAKEIASVLRFDERYTRLLANESNGKIISGQLGYKLTILADEDEVFHCANWLRHQAKMMHERSSNIYKVWNQNKNLCGANV